MKKNRVGKWQELGAKLGGYLTVSALVGIIVFCALFCAFAAILCNMDFPIVYLVPIVNVIACTAVLPAAFTMARLAGRRGLLYGLLLGGLLFMLLWLAAIVQGSSAFSQLAGMKFLAMILSGAVGGFLGTLSVEKKAKLKPHG